MANPYAEPMIPPGSQQQDSPPRAFAAPCGETLEPVEHELSHMTSWGDPHPVALMCSCGRKYEVRAA